MSDLPSGFVLDSPGGKAPPMGLPPGFVLDETKGKADSRNTSDATAQAFGQGATFNFGDEATAAVRAAAPGLSNFMMSGPALKRDESIGGNPTPQTVSTVPTFQGRYDEELARERAKATQFEKDSPVLSTGANIAGSAASTVPLVMAAGPAMVSSLFGNIIRQGAAGAALGGTAGFGAGEGDIVNRIGHALMGAGAGGVLGGAAPVVGAGVNKLMQTPWGQSLGQNVIAPAARTIASLTGQQTPMRGVSAAAADGGNYIVQNGLQGVADRLANPAETGAVAQIAKALQRARMDPAQVERRLGQLGEGGMLADVDPQFQSLATGAKVLPGGTRSYAKTALEARETDYPRLMTQAFEGAEPPPSTFKLRGEGQAFDQNARAVGARAYQGDMVDAGMKQTPELMALYENPYVDQALKTVMDVEKKSRIGRPNAVPSSPIEILHKVKQTIWDMGFDKDTAKPGPNMSYFRDVGTDFVNKLKAANPALAHADIAYSQAKSLPEFFDAGRSLLQTEKGQGALTTGQAALEDMMPGADVQQRLASRAGMVNAAREQANTGPIGAVSLAKQVDRNKFTQGKLATAFDPAHAADIERTAAAVRAFRETQDRVLGGSQTVEKTSDALKMLGEGVPTSAKGVIGSIVNAIKQYTGPNESVRDAVGRATLNPDSNENRRILALAAELIRRRGAGAPVGSVLSETAGSQVGRQ